MKLKCAAAHLGMGIDSLPYADRPNLRSYGMLFEQLEAYSAVEFGRRERERLIEGHDIWLASALCLTAIIDADKLDAPAGIMMYARTEPTTMAVGTPGVALHRGGIKTVTMLFAGFVGGPPRREYSHVILMDYATDPTNVEAVAVQAFELARKARRLVRRLIPSVGFLPIIGDGISAAAVASGAEILEQEVSLGDMPLLLECVVASGEPFVFAAFGSSTGELVAPPGVWLDFTPRADADAERPGACNGITVRVATDVAHWLLEPPDLVARQLFHQLDAVDAVAHATRGGVMVPLGDHLVALMGVTYRPHTGGSSIAVTTIDVGDGGDAYIAAALGALFSAQRVRRECRERAGAFAQRWAISSRTKPGARTVAGMAMLAFGPTVPVRRAAMQQ